MKNGEMKEEDNTWGRNRTVRNGRIREGNKLRDKGRK